MFKISITNLINNRQFGANFETMEEANEWIAKQELKAKSGLGWGYSSRSIPKSEVPENLLPLIESEEVIDEVLIAHLKAEYEISIVDLDKDPAYILEKRIATKIGVGKTVKQKYADVIQDYIIGHNTLAGATNAQIDEMLAEFNPIYTAITEVRPKKAKALLAQAKIKGLITEEVKEDLLYLLKDITL